MKKILFVLILLTIVALYSGCEESGEPFVVNSPSDTTHQDSTDTLDLPPDSTGPGEFSLLSQSSFISNGQVIRFVSNYAFVGDGKQLKIVDVTNLNSPQLIFSFPEYGWQGYVISLDIKGDYAFVVEGQYQYNLQIVNIAIPSSPLAVATLNLGGTAEEVLVDSNYAYIASGTRGVSIIDITDVENPILVTRAATSNALSLTLAARYNLLVVGSGLRNNGGWSVDISNPTLPNVIGHYISPGYSWRLHYAYGYLFVADGALGVSSDGSFQVFQLHPSGIFSLVASDTLSASVQDVTTWQNFAYIVTWDDISISEFVAYEIHNPMSPLQIYSQALESSKAIDVREDGTIGIVGRGGLYLFSHQQDVFTE